MNSVTGRLLALLCGPLLCVGLYCLLPSHYVDSAGHSVVFGAAARWTVGCIAWMAVWWLSEVVPLAATSLLPGMLFPLLGVASLEATFAPYADPLLFLFLGGFVIAIAIEKWGLHRRLAYSLLGVTGSAPHLVLAILSATAFISLWLSNTATAVLMLPVALSIASHESATNNLRKCLMLAVAYGSTIGGMGTLIGTPPNVFVASFLRSNYGVSLDFWKWLAIGLPMVAVMLPFTFWLLTRMRFPLSTTLVLTLPDHGEQSLCWSHLPPAARQTLCVFALAAVAWTTRALLVTVEIGGVRPFTNLSDAGIAVTAAVALFALPVPGLWRPVLEWDDTRGIPWGTLLLFGGGLSLAAAITANGVDKTLGAYLAGVPLLPKPVVIAAIAATVIFVSEIASNIATAAALTPLLAAAAPAFGLTPVEAAVVTGLGASSAYMLPVGTAPNALAYGSGFLTTRDMAGTGIVLNLVSIALIVLVTCWVVPRVL